MKTSGGGSGTHDKDGSGIRPGSPPRTVSEWADQIIDAHPDKAAQLMRVVREWPVEVCSNPGPRGCGDCDLCLDWGEDAAEAERDRWEW